MSIGDTLVNDLHPLQLDIRLSAPNQDYCQLPDEMAVTFDSVAQYSPFPCFLLHKRHLLPN